MSRASSQSNATQRIAKSLQQRNPRLSESKALAKGQSVVQGILYIVMGVVAFVFALALPLVVLFVFRTELTIPMLVVIALVAGAAFFTGIWLVVGGGNVMSGEGIDVAADDMHGLFGLFAKGVRLLRKKNGST